MPGRLLDTNIVIALFANEGPVLTAFSSSPIVYVPSIVLGELYYGAQASARVAENVKRIGEFSGQASVLSPDDITALEYGLIKFELRSLGKPIPDNDVWIAALARQYDLELVTRDRHFDNVFGLKLLEW